MASSVKYKPFVGDEKVLSWRLPLKLVLKYLAVFSILCFHYLSQGMHSYVVTEWTQHKVKMENFQNTSTAHVSSCIVNKTSEDYKRSAHVQQEASKWQMYNTLASCVPALVTTIVFPSMTDTYGRKFLFILSVSGLLVNKLISAAVVYLNGRLEFIVAGYFVTGLTGTAYCLLCSTYSYIADITPAGKRRSFVLTLEDAFIQTFMTISALATGYFIQSRGYVYPIFTSCGISVLTLLTAIFVLPESLDLTNRLPAPSFRDTVARPFRFYASKHFKGSRGTYVILMFANVFADISNVHRTTLEALYQLAAPFCWSPSQIGLFATLRKGGQGIVGVSFVILLQLCIPDVAIAIFSALLNTGSYIMEAFAQVDWLLYLVAAPAIFEFLAAPLIRGLMSKMTPKEEQGALFASISMVQNMCALLAGIGDNTIYSATIFIMNGFVFLVLASLSALTVILLGIYVWKNKVDEPVEESKSIDTIHPDTSVNPS